MEFRLLYFLLIYLAFHFYLCYSGHEVLYEFDTNKFHQKIFTLKPQDLLILQFDSRPLSTSQYNDENYWNISAYWNKKFALKHGHGYQLLSMRDEYCKYADYKLSPVWCKVKAMMLIDSHSDFQDYKAILYLDTDAVITVNYSMTHVISYIQHALNWDVKRKPFAFNQDGPGFSCKHTMKFGYKFCLNSGTILWHKSLIATEILHNWWNSAGWPYDQVAFKVKFRDKWPWEQATMYSIYEKFKDYIIILSFPDQPYLPWLSTKNPKSQYPTDSVEPWCFSHMPGANCFITHRCASVKQKNKMIDMYHIYSNDNRIDIFPIYLEDLKA